MEIISKSESQTLSLAKRIAKFLSCGDIICLFGTLGAGKTVFAKGIARGLGLDKKGIISPSFVLLRQYQPFGRGKSRKPPLYHFDLYRLKNIRDILDLGYEEYFYGNGISVIEWADKLGWYLPREYLGVDLKIKGERERQINITSFGRAYRGIILNLKNETRNNKPRSK
ncbi:MAG: tRNA (adenosine(37)-N6)-threonylcarbamoyltransferase complex ATPase subunit type 1 TsaE [Candidatus Omnitrophica bacterium]|nr:tRNA (adenosine(37)-N6)-threonylcarbamoyltransferase complex ATPase subunit type 1 TsaE [Candidatus Omnitrophota bacterium]